MGAPSDYLAPIRAALEHYKKLGGHHARAALALLARMEEEGRVQWTVRYDDGYESRGFSEPKWAEAHAESERQDGYECKVVRVLVLPAPEGGCRNAHEA